MKKIILLLIPLLLLVSCKETIKDAIKKKLEESGDETVVESNFKQIKVDRLYALSVPKYMKEMNNLNDQATLQYGNVYKDLYTTVTHEDIQDFMAYSKEIGAYVDSLSILENYTNAQLNYFNQNIKDCKIDFYSEEKINNYDARQFKFTGKVAHQDVAYLMAYVETEADLFLIVNWTSLDRFSRFKDAFETINSSFEYIINTEDIDEIQ